MKKYIFELIVNEGNDEFWESLKDISGCDEVTAEIRQVLTQYGFYDGDNCHLTLKQFINEK